MRWPLALTFLAVALLALGQPAPRFEALVFSSTAGFRHASIADGIEALQDLGRERGFHVEATEDPSVFTDAGLLPYQVVVFLCTSGDVLDASQEAAFERFVRAGGGWAGIHSAADTEYDWPFYELLLGAYFDSHPPVQPAALDVADAGHPSTAPLPARWMRTDEWYDFRSNPRPQVQVLLTLDESSYKGGKMGKDHPVSWAHEAAGGRAWYTALGHTPQSWSETLFRAHVLGGIEWAAGARPVPAWPGGGVHLWSRALAALLLGVALLGAARRYKAS
jgi:type 1 glutamine amidotransferase